MDDMKTPESTDTDHRQALEAELTAVSATLAERRETHRRLRSTFAALLREYSARVRQHADGKE